MNSETFRKNIKQILIPEADLQAKIKEVGAQISKEYEGKPLLLVSILNGAFVFMADLCRAITIPCETAFMCAKSYYSGTVSTGVVKITMDLQQDISNYHVIIAEDIIDTGRTLNDVKKMLTKIKGVGSKVANCCMLFGLDKRDAFPVDVWIKRIMEQLYFSGKETDKEKIAAFAKTRFGSYGGYAQQYLFFYGKTVRIGTQNQKIKKAKSNY